MKPVNCLQIRENPKVLNDWVGVITKMTAEDDGRVARREIDKADRAKADEMAAERARIDQAKADAATMRRDPAAAKEVRESLRKMGLSY